MEFLGLLLMSVVLDLLFGKVCSVTGQAILDAACSDQDCSAVMGKAGEAAQQVELKRANKGAFLTGLVGLAFWCVVAAGLYLLCVV